MQKLYLDCDGVILNTIFNSYKLLREQGITREEEIIAYYKQLDWDAFITSSGEIDNASLKIRTLYESRLFDIKILTHVNSEKEALAKKNYFRGVLPEVEVITVFKDTKKADAVEAKDAILVDDYLGNLEDWYEKGGIPIKFSDSGKECQFVSITNLLELFTLIPLNGKTKRRGVNKK